MRPPTGRPCILFMRPEDLARSDAPGITPSNRDIQADTHARAGGDPLHKGSVWGPCQAPGSRLETLNWLSCRCFQRTLPIVNVGLKEQCSVNISARHPRGIFKCVPLRFRTSLDEHRVGGSDAVDGLLMASV